MVLPPLRSLRELTDRGLSKNRCGQCGELKRGHVCQAPRPLVTTSLNAQEIAENEARLLQTFGGSPGGAHGTRRGGAARRGRRRTYSGGDSSGADTPLLTPGASFARIAAEDRAARARHRERRRAMTVAGLARASAAGTGTTAWTCAGRAARRRHRCSR